jgi:predicted DNA-binding transcriptional regulator YafY
MSFHKLTTLSYLHYLIKNKRTGTPQQLAEKLGVSKRTTYNYIGTLKNMGAPILFCYLSNSYCYLTDWHHPAIDTDSEPPCN